MNESSQGRGAKRLAQQAERDRLQLLVHTVRQIAIGRAKKALRDRGEKISLIKIRSVE
jgi:hypothetical protein